MLNRERLKTPNPEFLDVCNNAQRVRQFFAVYYRTQNRNGAVLDAAPEFFLVKPEVLTELVNDVRGSEQTWLKECINRATARQGYVAISKHHNSKLDYYWIDFSVMPFMLGDELGAGDNAPFFYAMDHFIAFSKKFPHVYGCLTEAANLDHDLAHMLNDIRNRARGIERLAVTYDANMLITFDPSWPLDQVNKLLASLKENRQGWCQVLFEYILHVISTRTMERRASSVTETPLSPPYASKNSAAGSDSINTPSALMPLSSVPQQKQWVESHIADQSQQQRTAPLQTENVLQERLAAEQEIQQQAEQHLAAERAVQENLQAQILSMHQQHEQRLRELAKQAEQQKTALLEQQQAAQQQLATTLQERLSAEQEIQQQAEQHLAAERALQENLHTQILFMHQQHEQRLRELDKQAEQQKTALLEQQQAAQQQLATTLQERLSAEQEIQQQAQQHLAAERSLQENLQAQILSMHQQHEQRLCELTEQAEQQKTALLEQQQAMLDEISSAQQVGHQKTQQLIEIHQAEKLALQEQEQASLAAIQQQHLREMSALTSAMQRKITQLHKKNNWSRSSWELRQLFMNVSTPRFFAASGWGIAALILIGSVLTLNFTTSNTAAIQVEKSHSIASASVPVTPCNNAMVQGSEHSEEYFVHGGLKMSKHLQNTP